MDNKYYGKGEYKPNRQISKELRKKSINSTKDEHLNEWYSTYYDAQFFMDCTGTDYLLNFYNKKYPFYGRRFDDWFKKLNLDDNIHLDLGFSTGKSLYWLGKRYPNIVIDSFDFNDNCKNIFSPLKELIPQIRNLSIQDASKINYPKNSYDSITAIDFYEHIPKQIMVNSLKLNYKVLKNKGTMHVYVGKSPNEEHINLIPDKETIKICEEIGFTFLYSNNQLLTFSK